MWGDLLTAGAMAALGVFLVLWRERFFQAVLESGERLRDSVGLQRFARAFCTVCIVVIATGSFLGSAAHFYRAVTGRDWPLHYASWSNLWPF